MIKISKEQSFYIKGASLLIFILIYWLTLAPSQLGGPLKYVIVNGKSMEPGFILGDLVLVREEPVYSAGDAVVYHDPELQQFVFHRVVGMETDRFILQGDNNGWFDSYRPTQNEIVGELWLHVPNFGKLINWVRVPVNAAITAGLFGVLLMMDLFKRTPRTKRVGGSPPIHVGATSQLSVAIFSALTVLFLIVGVFAFTRPVDLPAENILYQQTGDYYYSATGTPGVYDTDVVQTGEPVFPKLTCFLNIGFTYTLIGDGIQNVTGTQSMYARIMDKQSGWQRTVPLYPETVFNGTSNFMMSTLDLCQVESIVNLVEAQAGLKQIAYTLEIVNDVTFTASVNGQVISDTFSPVLTFNYDKIHFFLAETEGVDTLHAVKAGMAGSTTAQANSISIFGFALPVWLLRVVSVFGSILSVLGGSMAGVSLYRDASRTEDRLFQLKYGGMLIHVHEQNLEPYSVVVNVHTMDDLARLADRYGSMILHMQRNFLHYYFVQNNGTTYRYVVTSGKKGVAAVDEPEDVQVVIEQSLMPEPEPENKDIRRKRPKIETLPRRVAEKRVPVRRVDKAQEPIKQAPVMEEAPNYVIDTGEIEFYVPVKEETYMIERVRF